MANAAAASPDSAARWKTSRAVTRSPAATKSSPCFISNLMHSGSILRTGWPAGAT